MHQKNSFRSLKKYSHALLLSSFLLSPSALSQTTETYEYDALGRLVEVDNSSSNDVVDYSYDEAGNRTKVQIALNVTASFSINDIHLTEGNNFVFTVTKSGSSTGDTGVSYSTANNTALAGSDYTATSGTLTFSSSDTTKTITVPSSDDSVDEDDIQQFYVNLANATGGAGISDSQGVGHVYDNDAGPSFSINNPSGTEGSSVTFTITKTGATEKTHAVSYATAATGSAEQADFTSKTGAVSFSPSQTTQTVSVSTVNDSTFEGQETFNLNLSNATNSASISDSQGDGAINDNDAAPSFSVNNAIGNEGGPRTFTITKSGATELTHNVSYATANGSAGSSDYTAKSGSLSFTPSQTSKTVVVQTTEDSIDEDLETFYLNLSSPTNSATISDSQGNGDIIDDDGECGLLMGGGGDLPQMAQGGGVSGQSGQIVVGKTGGGTTNFCL